MGDPVIRGAREADLPEIVRLLADDFLGSARELVADPLPESYVRAFREVERDSATSIYVMELDGAVIGTMQLTFIPGLQNQGAMRMDIEGVRIESALRSRGLGEQLIRWAVELARERGCGLVQLSSHKRREGAHRFYTRLGFDNSHEGFKLSL